MGPIGKRKLMRAHLADRYLAVLMLLEEFTSRVNGGRSVADLLVEDATLATPRGQIAGRDAIANLFQSTFEARRANERVSRHFNSNLTIRSLDSDWIEARSLLTALAIDPTLGAKGSLLIGDQLDIIIPSSDGLMQFKSRKMVPQLNFELAPSAGAHP
ncbi:MAG TPA: nuclear transport factor 2 family protein [Steroidobacteraceae bacterium]